MMVALQKLGANRYTFADYMAWDDGARYELIDGIAYAMSPSPNWIHQNICVKIVSRIANFLEGKPCMVFASPFDVRLNADGEDDTVVQPDILVVCDRKKLDPKGYGYRGAPEMVVEIVSPSTARMDRLVKYKKYQQFGVKEYWIVYPATRTVEVHLLANGQYIKKVYDETDTVPVHVLEGCLINFAEVFAEAVQESDRLIRKTASDQPGGQINEIYDYLPGDEPAADLDAGA